MLHLERSWEKTWRSRLGPGLRTRVLQVLGPGWAQAEAPHPTLSPQLSQMIIFSPPAIAGLIAAAAGQCNSAVQRTSRCRGPSGALPVAGRHLVRKWRPLGASFVGGVQQTLPSACAERRLSASASRSGVQQIPPSACAERRCQRRLLLT